MPNEAIYEVRVKLSEDNYDGPVIDEGRAMRALLGEITDGEDDVPVVGLDFVKVQKPGPPAAPPEEITAALVIKLREMHARAIADHQPGDDDAYFEGHQDAVREALESIGEEVS
jgi:hypothetical protein